MSYARPNVRVNGLAKDARNGDGWLAFMQPVIQATDSNQVFPTASIVAGLYVRSGMTASRTDTTDTAVAILAAMPEMDVGDSFVTAVSVTTAFALVLAAGTGMTAVGAKTIAASGFGFILWTKTSSTTMSYQVL